jgi:soluble lytic murein transglycosylase
MVGTCRLRGEQWAQLEQITRAMPAAVAGKPAWQYWRARSLKQLGRGNEAPALFARASVGHHYYALLSLEELGNACPHRPARPALPQQTSAPCVAIRPSSALALLDISTSEGRGELRSDAQREWRWAMRGRNDMELLAAAEIGRREAFYDMAIYSAERTKEDHDYSLRYLTPTVTSPSAMPASWMWTMPGSMA